MLTTIKKAIKIPELRKRILFTLAMLFVFRLGSFISVPFVNQESIANLVQENAMFGLLNIISGNNFAEFSIFAMSITPYINASIIIQLLTIALPPLERLRHQGEEGSKKLTSYTRYLTVILALIQALGLSISFKQILEPASVSTMAIVALSVTAGTAFLMWLGENITEYGIGNGISLLIFAGIVTRIPSGIEYLYEEFNSGAISAVLLIVFAIFVLAVIAGVVEMTEGTRKIPVQYAKRVVGRKMYGGQNTHIPLKIDQSGVMPIIFASTITMFPSTLASFFPNSAVCTWLKSALEWGKTSTTIIYVILIIFFTYFYTLVTFNPHDVADNLKQYGGFIPGIRPGVSTVNYLQRTLNRLMVAGSIFLAVIAVLPIIIGNVMNLSLQFGGTSLLIVVGVALELVRQLEQQMIMRNYQGFLK